MAARIFKRLSVIFFSLFAFSSLCVCSRLSALTDDTEIRIGLVSLYNEVNSIAINNESVLAGFERNGELVGDILHGSFSVAADFSAYSLTGETASSYAEAAGAAAKTGGIPACVGAGNWTVYSPDVNGSTSSRRVAVIDGGKTIAIFDSASDFPQIANADGEMLRLGERSYRGRVEFGRYAGAALTAVNVVNIDEYLYSSVPSEMPSGWPIEALKAQAVAARSYTRTRRGVHADEGYELCDGVHCQMYLGAGNESESARAAVDATSGVMAYYGGRPINATYFSSSGGVTEDGDKVWGNEIPYLKSVKEVAEKEYKVWTRSFQFYEIERLITESIGKIVNVSIDSNPVSGRARRMTITGETGEKIIEKDAIRSFFTQSADGPLDSLNFSVSPSEAPISIISVGSELTDKNIAEIYITSSNAAAANPGAFNVISVSGSYSMKNTDSVTFIGKGWGHGVGMSQYGAKGMAEEGYSYDQILRHYFTGIEVK
ncbi:MAG: SpoIID/LytB domain-containing protein [Clostridiales bacterium]|jgi:stage II sporulation protein D|nr:SpoIID/LytB domain-containing protein [Clostridiales bacterium]